MADNPDPFPDLNQDPIPDPVLRPFDVNEEADPVQDSDTVDSLIQRSQEMEEFGENNTKAYEQLLIKLHATFWNNMQAPPTIPYKPKMPGEAMTLFQDSLILTEKGHVSLTHCVNAFQSLHQQALHLGCFLSETLVEFLLFLSKFPSLATKFDKFKIYFQEIGKNNPEMKVIHNINAILTTAQDLLQNNGNAMLHASFAAHDVDGLLHRFEQVIWQLQKIFTYPQNPNSLILSALETSPIAIDLNNCHKALHEVSHLVHNFNTSAPSLTQTAGSNLQQLKASLMPFIKQNWS